MGKHDPYNGAPWLVALKQRAALIKGDIPTLSHSQALELAARERGYKTYAAFRAAHIEATAHV